MVARRSRSSETSILKPCGGIEHNMPGFRSRSGRPAPFTRLPSAEAALYIELERIAPIAETVGMIATQSRVEGGKEGARVDDDDRGIGVDDALERCGGSRTHGRIETVAGK